MNITAEVVIVGMSAIPTLISVLLLLKQYRIYPDPVLRLMSATWFLFVLYNSLSAISYLLLSIPIIMVRSTLLSLIVILVEIMMSYLNSEKVNSARMSIVSILSFISFYSVFQEDAFREGYLSNGDKTIYSSGLFRTISTMIIIYIMTLYVYYTVKIYWYSSSDIKNDTFIFLIGAVILGPFALLAFLLDLNEIIPGITEIFFAIGIFTSSYALYKQPQLIYVLPFKAMKLIVINSYTGAMLYTHNWAERKDEVKTPLISSALTSINAFTKEAINRGDIEQIKLSDGVLFIENPVNQNIYYVLIATKSSYTLQIGLKKFSKLFFEKFNNSILDSNIVLISTLKDADELIPICFPYIPSFIQ